MEVYPPPPPIVGIEPDVAVLRFACITCILSTSRIFSCFFFFFFFCFVLFSFLFVVVSFFCFFLSCLFV